MERNTRASTVSRASNTRATSQARVERFRFSWNAPQKVRHSYPSSLRMYLTTVRYMAAEDAPIVITGMEKTIQRTLRHIQSKIRTRLRMSGLPKSKKRFIVLPPYTLLSMGGPRRKQVSLSYGLVYSLREENSTALFSANSWMVLPLAP